MAIENIIFDLGGVIYDIDYHKTIHAFESLGIFNAEEIYSQARQTSVFDHYEKGESTTEEFVTALQNIIDKDVKAEDIKQAWNALLLGIPPHRLEFLLDRKKEYKIFLLSNTNELHINHLNKELKAMGHETLHPFFHTVYYSYEMGMRKPDVEIFEAVLKRERLDPQKTLFIDDTEQHIKGAQKAGIQTYHHTSGDIVEVIDGVVNP